MASFQLKRKTITADLIAGTTTALVTIPDGLDSAILAGVNPVSGLYALMIGTPVAALTMSSLFMYVANTGALAVAVGDALTGLSEVGSTFIRVVERHAQVLQKGGGKLMLSGVHERVKEQMDLTETTETIDDSDMFMADEHLGASRRRAQAAASAWLSQISSEATETSEEEE